MFCHTGYRESVTHIIGKREISLLNELLSLPATGNEQDWEIELADPSRVVEFLDIYEQLPENVGVRRALWALITASLNDALDQASQPPKATQERYSTILQQEFGDLFDIVEEWCISADAFPVTQIIVTARDLHIAGKQNT